jgi:MFS family permease
MPSTVNAHVTSVCDGTKNKHQGWRTSGTIRLSRPQMIGTLSGLMLAMLLAALDQTIVGTAEPMIIASLSGFNRYPWVATAYLLCSTISVPIFAKLSDIYGRNGSYSQAPVASS